MDTPDLDPLARAIFRAEERVRAARARLHNAQSSLESADAEVANAGRELDQRMTDLEGEMLTLDALRNGQAVPAEAARVEGLVRECLTLMRALRETKDALAAAEARSLPLPRRYTGGPLEDGLWLWRFERWDAGRWESEFIKGGRIQPWWARGRTPEEPLFLAGPISIPPIPESEGASS